IVSGTVPLGAANRAGTEMDGLADDKRRVLVLHSGDRHPVEQGIGVEIEAVKVAVLRGDGQNLLAAGSLDNGWSAGNVPVVPVLRNDLEVVLVGPSHRVEDDDRAGIKVRPFPHAG